MLTIFSTPKPFNGHIGIIQRNAITSWTLLYPRPEIFLFGNDEGAAEAAKDIGVLHVSHIAQNEFGTPLLNDVFQKAEQQASHQTLCYVNADILLLDDFSEAVVRVLEWRPQCLMIGRRWDVDIREPINFAASDWQRSVRQLALRTDRQRSPEWIDYFAFSRGLGANLLPFAIGRTRWDNWLIWHARSMGRPVLDLSESVMVVHQNHDYGHHHQGHKGVWTGVEARRNNELSGGCWRHYTTEDATHRFGTDGIRPNFRRWSVKLQRATSLQSIWFSFLDLTRPIRHRLGLRKKSLG
jgi:hypothetical protein